MIQRTKTTFGFAVLYSVFFVGGLAVVVYIITIQGSQLEAAKESIAEQSAKNAAYQNVMQLLDSSAAARTELSSYFISEKDTITFMSELETAANTIGVTLNTTQLSIVPGTSKNGITTPAVLMIGVHFTGGETAVKKYIQLLENVPYHKSLPNFSVTMDTVADVWDVTTSLRLTMKP